MNRIGWRGLGLAMVTAAMIAFAAQQPAGAADMRSTTWSVRGVDKLHEVERRQVGSGFKKKVSNERDTFAVTLTFDPGGSESQGTFSITDYESFPVIGTWTSTKANKVILTVNQTQLQADLANEVCPGGSCVLESSWLPFTATLHQNQTKISLEWVERIKWTNPDTTFVKLRFIFTSKGPQPMAMRAKPSSEDAGAHHRH